ncbi:iron ABC transporter permease [Candidatus Bipolaricaulota bacterium]|nr:iron ABC transporter permease [Candidatus Bipolaricaulota bacterium]
MIRKDRSVPWILVLLPVSAFILALFLGRYGIHILDTVRVLLGLDGPSDVFRALILRVRLPRVLAAACVGANLAVVGAAFQGLFRNPLVDSRILGVSSGAAFGAALALLFTSQGMIVQTSAFIFALVAIALVMLVGVRFGSSTLVLVIGGILVGALFNSLLGLIKYVADPLSTLPAITYWLLGSLNATQWSDLPPLLTITGVGLPFFALLRWRLNLLTVSDTEAMAMGIRVRLIRTVIVAVGTLLVAASVALAGTIGWIGLVIPHVARVWVGPDYGRLIPASAALGAATLILLDTLARTAMPSEIPLGVLTGLIGVPAFFILFLRFLRTRGEAQ